MMLHKSFKPAKCKTALNLAKSRIKLMKNKKDIQFRQLKKEIAVLLQAGQDQTARIRVEHVVREEKMMAAYEMIEIYCELIVARLPIIESQKTCPLDLKEAIASLVFAAPRCGDIPELQDVRKHFTAKYGKDFVTAAIEIRPQCGVSRTLIEKLSVKAPDGPTKVKILKGIAEEHSIQWEPNWFKDEEPLFSTETWKEPHAESSTKIQMEPLDAQFADDPVDKNDLDVERPETFSTIRAHANSNKIQPSSLGRREPRPSGDVSEDMRSSQSSGTADSVSSSGRQYWNMEFKDATAAAQAAAESADRASMAAKAAAELASRSNIVSSSFNQRSPKTQRGQRASNKDGTMTERTDVSDAYKDTQSGVYRETRHHDFEDSESSSYVVNQDNSKQSQNSVSTPSSSKAQYSLLESSNFQEYDSEPVENLFYEERVELQHQPSKLESQSIPSDGAYAVFSNMNSESGKYDSDDGFSTFNQGTSDSDVWHARTAYPSKFDNSTEEMIFRDQGLRSDFLKFDEKHLFDSGSGVSAGMDQRISGVETNEKGSAEAVFDDYGSDVDDIFDRTENNSSSAKSLPNHSSLLENHNFEPALSESFRSSSLYSKLIEPLPVFDDCDGSSSESEEQRKTENTQPEIGRSYYSGKPDRHSGFNSALIGRSSAEKGSFDPVASIKHEEYPSIYVDSVDEDMVRKSPRSLRLSLESQGGESKFDSETRSSPRDGMELNLGSLPGGRRNRSSWRPSYKNAGGGLADVSSPSRSSRTAAKEAFGASEESSSAFESGQMVIQQTSIRYATPGDDSETGIAPKLSDRGIRQNPYKATTKDPTGYFDSDDGASEEDLPKPVTGKNLLGDGISRRTKKVTAGSVAISRPSTTSYVTEALKHPAENRSGSFKFVHQSTWDHEASSHLRSDKIASKTKNSLSPAVVENPATPVAAEVPRATVTSAKALSRENSGKNPSHVHPKLPDFEALTAHLESLRTNRQ